MCIYVLGVPTQVCQLAPLGLHQTRPEICACIKRIASLSQNYPSELLYVSGKYGGRNCARLSNAVHIDKLAILHSYPAPRLIADKFNGYHPMIMSSLLGRVLRAGGVIVPPGEHIDIVHLEGRSLVKYLGQINLTITMDIFINLLSLMT